MEEIKSHALALCILLIITGTVSKLLPEKSNKSMLKFVVTLIILSSVFGIDISQINFYKSTFDYDNGQAVEIKTEEAQKLIESIYEDEVENTVREIIENYDEKSEINYDTENKTLTVEAIISDDNKQKLKKEIYEKFGPEIKIIFKQHNRKY